jgi:excisionase family DNA binding protein
MRTKLLRLEQVARRLRFSKASVLRRVRTGEIRAIRLSRRAFRVEEAELLRYLERQRGA